MQLPKISRLSPSQIVFPFLTSCPLRSVSFQKRRKLPKGLFWPATPEAATLWLGGNNDRTECAPHCYTHPAKTKHPPLYCHPSLLQSLTGYYTGSDTHPERALSKNLAALGMAGEGVVNRTVWAVKTHYPERPGWKRFAGRRVVLLVCSTRSHLICTLFRKNFHSAGVFLGAKPFRRDRLIL